MYVFVCFTHIVVYCTSKTSLLMQCDYVEQYPSMIVCSVTKHDEWNVTVSQSWDQNGFQRNHVNQSVNFLSMFSWIVFAVRYVLCHVSYTYFSLSTAVSQSIPSVPSYLQCTACHCEHVLHGCISCFFVLTWQQIIRAVHCQVLPRSMTFIVCLCNAYSYTADISVFMIISSKSLLYMYDC